MQTNRKKELLMEYKNRMPEKGIIRVLCLATNESFLEISNDTKATINSITVKLSSHYHPNRHLLNLWQLYSQEGFEFSAIKVLQYEDPTANYKDKLEKMRDECLALDPLAQKVWK